MQAAFEPAKGEQPIFIVSGQSPAWTELVLPNCQRHLKAMAQASDPEPHARKWWERKTNVSPAESALTIIIPIHNERKYLESVLSSIMLSRIPREVDAQFVLITNACSDNSKEIAERFLSRLGALCQEQIPRATTAFDPGLEEMAHVCRLGRISFKLLNTKTPGKANALTIGNKLAISQGHSIAMCLDANNWPHPAAIANMYGALNRELQRKKDAPIVASGRPLFTTKGSRSRIVLDSRFPPPAPHSVSGCIMAWTTEFVDRLGEFPRTKSEDYALGVLARAEGGHVVHPIKAISCGYSPSRFAELFKCQIRSAVGSLQLRKFWNKLPIGPTITQLVEADRKEHREFLFGKGLATQIKNFLALAVKDPPAATRKLGGFVIRRVARVLGYLQFLKAPTSQTWDPIKSTKG